MPSSENANAFSIHVTRFKHKIYRWLCFAFMRDLENGTDQERIQDRAFLSVLGNRDVCCVARLFAKLVFFDGHLVIKQALLECFVEARLKCRIWIV
jgi:hypothetical protein